MGTTMGSPEGAADSFDDDMDELDDDSLGI
jgi:hypothetical protein